MKPNLADASFYRRVSPWWRGHFLVAIFLLLTGAWLTILPRSQGADIHGCQATNECLMMSGELVMKLPISSRTFRQNFEAITDGAQWKARLIESDTNAAISYWEYGTDGDAVYSITAFNTNYSGGRVQIRKDGTMRTNVGGIGKVVGGAVVSATTVPVDGDTFIVSLWMAYFSGCYLSEAEAKGHTEFPPLYASPLRTYVLVDKVPPATARWELSSTFPRLPSSLVLFDGPYFAFSELRGKGSDVVLASPRGTTNLIFTPGNQLRVAGWTVPSSFETIGFAYQSPEAQGSRLVSFVMSGKINTAQVTNAPAEFLPRFPGVTRVADHRLQKERAASYLASNQWPSIAELENEKIEAVAAGRRKRTIPAESNNALPLFIGITAFGAAMFVWISRRNKK